MSRFNDVPAWLRWQESLHHQEIELGLARGRTVLHALQWDTPAFPLISVAGTNGKGSTVAYLESILLAAGYRVCAHTSPHLLRYNERIRLDGKPIADSLLLDAFDQVDAARGDTSLTYFEFATLAAMAVSRSEAVDVALFEVGLGGRLDAVNLFDADIAVITAIGIDHVEYLGGDRESIGREKAGIMRATKPVIVSDAQPPASVAHAADAIGAQPHWLGKDFDYTLDSQRWEWRGAGRRLPDLPRLPMPGEYQYRNASGAIAALECLALNVPARAVRTGLTGATVAGRFEQVSEAPDVFLDVGHNAQATQAMASILDELPSQGRTIAVVGMLENKQHRHALRALCGRIEQWCLADVDGPRASPARTLADALVSLGDVAPRTSFRSPVEAFRHAQSEAGPSDRILVFGSFLTVAGVLAELKERNR